MSSHKSVQQVPPYPECTAEQNSRLLSELTEKQIKKSPRLHASMDFKELDRFPKSSQGHTQIPQFNSN